MKEKSVVSRVADLIARIFRKPSDVREAVGADWYRRNGYYRLADLLQSSGPTWTGRTINEVTALETTAVLACVRIISEDVGTLPLSVYRQSGDRKRREKAYDHWAYSVLHDSPNSYQTACEFRESMTAQALLYGVAAARIVPVRGGKIELENVLPADLAPAEQKGRWKIREADGTWRSAGPSELFILKGFSVGGAAGIKLIATARQAIALASAQEEYSARFFSNDATPGVILEHPGKLSSEAVQRIKEAWAAAQQGMKNAHLPAVLQEGMKASKVALNAEESQMIEQRRFQIAEICRLFRMPPHKVGDLERATFSNIEEQNIQYYAETLRPQLVRWEQSIGKYLLAGQPEYFAEHSIEGLLRGNFATQTQGFSLLLEKGVYSVNEVREYLNLNPIPNGDGHLAQVNRAPIGEIGTIENEDDTSGGKDDAVAI